jgi:tRNA (pseudouridine54-N1)-methyltransferase
MTAETQRAFVVVSHTAPLEGDFSLSDLPGGAGRLDILCRCATEAFLISHGMRKYVELYLVIRERLVIRLEGERLRHLNPDERSTAALIRRAIMRAQGLPPGEEARSTPGIYVRWAGLGDVIEELVAAGFEPVVLEEDGAFLRRAPLPKRPAFLLSDHRDFTPEEREIIAPYPKISVGPLSLHGHQCITLVHNELDLREAGWLDGSS